MKIQKKYYVLSYHLISQNLSLIKFEAVDDSNAVNIYETTYSNPFTKKSVLLTSEKLKVLKKLIEENIQ